MILQREIIQKAREWQVPPDTVDKDYVLGHFLSILAKWYGKELIFKGGTCLRKCYIEQYRFSEDLDFSAVDKDFVLESKTLKRITELVTERTGILCYAEPVKPLLYQDQPKGYQVKIKYWGANHSKNQSPLPHHRWLTKIKLEISTDELILMPSNRRMIMHPYSDDLKGAKSCYSYSIKEVIAEKLRALKQRSYTAPRDFYDIYHLTNGFSENDWRDVYPVFIAKMNHKNIAYESPSDLIPQTTLEKAKRAWKTSLAHQITDEQPLNPDKIIEIVSTRIKENL